MAATLKLGQAQTTIGESEGINLDDLVGSVTTTQKLKLAPFEGRTILGVMRDPSVGWVNVLSEPSEGQLKEGAMFSAVPAYTYASPGSARVQVMLKNLTAHTVTVGKGQVIAELKPANAIPKMLAPKVVEETNESAPEGSGRGTSSKDSPREPSPEDRENAPYDATPRTKLTESQMAELYKKLELEKHTEGWGERLKRELREIMDEYGFLFALDSLDLGKTDVVKHHIELSDYTPIKDRYRRIPPHQYDEVRKHLQEMLAVGAIRKWNSPWASPVVLVRKKDGSLRFCIDLRKLNARTVKDAYSLPRIEDALDSLDGACLFTSLDLKSGYWQVELDEESIPLTAFTVGTTRVLRVRPNALRAHQRPCNLPTLDGNLP